MMIDLKLYFQKKEIPLVEWEIKSGSQTHYITSSMVLDHIMKMQGEQREVIGNTIFSLDFRGSPLIDYLHTLAKAMVKNAQKE